MTFSELQSIFKAAIQSMDGARIAMIDEFEDMVLIADMQTETDALPCLSAAAAWGQSNPKATLIWAQDCNTCYALRLDPGADLQGIAIRIRCLSERMAE